MTETVPQDAIENVRLPEGWAMTTLGEICARIEKANPKDNPEETFTYLDIAAIDNGTQRITQTKTYTGADAPSRARQIVKSGDVLFSTVRTYLKNIAQVPQAYDNQIASTGFTVIRPMLGIEDGFLFHLVQTNEFLEPLNAKQRGTSYPAVRDADVFAQPVALPPLNEQRRIVEKIEELFTKLDAGVRSLEQVQAQLKSYRRSVLKAAVEGELSREWREAHRDELEPASELMERILRERREKFAGKKYKEPASPDVSKLPTLPDSWEWARLDSLASIKGGITKDSKRKHENSRIVPYLRVANVQRGYLDLSEVKEIEASEDVIEQLLLKPGDVLFTEGGDRDKLGRGWIWNDEISGCIHQNHVFRARLYSADIESKFVSWFGNTFGQVWFMEQGKQTTNLASINLTKLSAFPVPLPPLEEQRFIVEEVERRLSVVDKLEATVEENLKQAGGLRQSILKQAFSGELVPQDPDDEPVGVLLARIRKKRESMKQKPRAKREKERHLASRDLYLFSQDDN